MAKDQTDTKTIDALPGLVTYIATLKYVHDNGSIRSAQVGVEADSVENATTKAHAIAREQWDKYKITSVKPW